MYKPFSHILLLFACLLGNSVWGQGVDKVQPPSNGYIDLNGYYDSRNFSVMTLNVLASLPKNFSYFSLTNFQSAGDDSGAMTLFSEQNVRWKVKKNTPFDLMGQWVMNSGASPNKFRLGIRISLNNKKAPQGITDKIKLSYSIGFHLLEINTARELNYVTQLEHVYRIDIFPRQLGNRIYIGGFADQNLTYSSDQNPSFKWVSEHQLGLRMIDKFYVVLEYRINDFLPADNTGLGYGLEYKITF